ncbi:N-acetylmuramoyl-L-alanine amidase [Aquimarina sp. U1-2]|uniref:N-acetylmuramoyl-L-alanine amidase n=1 Tax=Aquimarina sp. U1-2 TaxID=2823141 RepID=UPI001AECF8EC|nr:N-acetylmuramoyl-L-alanine amidase [Aquimarina sp. U1-2]MBP2831937.1 N-acetylmuramoyl-L-alanine amidase [Aquimarina sp. U1-2]
MKASSILTHEKSFFKTGKDSHGKQFIITPKSIPTGDGELMNYFDCKRQNNDDSFYFDEIEKKTKIVLHFTAGYLKGDIAQLTIPSNNVSVPFVIARDGSILKLWSSKYWSYHLGRGAIGGNTTMSKQTIGIELSNIGFLKRIGDNLVSVYSDTDIYCNSKDTNLYKKLETPFRQENYFATFTKKQYHSLAILIKYLTNEYKIARNFLPVHKRYTTLSKTEVQNFEGILSHINYRVSGKWDIGEAFEWDQLIQHVDHASVNNL